MRRFLAFLLTAILLLSISALSTAEGQPSEISVGRRIHFGNQDWIVLAMEDGKALIIAEGIVEQRAYNVKDTGVTWEMCDLRAYLNGDYYDAFSDEERGSIIETQLRNADNPSEETPGGEATLDHVFVLSIEEVVEYFGDSGRLEEAAQNGTAYISDRYNNKRTAYLNGEKWSWWLRSPGRHNATAAVVDDDGTVDMYGVYVIHDIRGVRPALWLKLESGAFTVIPEETRELFDVSAILDAKTDGIQFGEPIWRVLAIEGGKALLITEGIVEKSLVNEVWKTITWKKTDIRKYLNGAFYDRFSADEKKMIAEAKNENKKNQWFGTAAGSATKDKVFLLSLEEVVRFFGDSGQLASKNPNDKNKIDDQYNEARIAADEDGNDWYWWLRSFGGDGSRTAVVDHNGRINVDGAVFINEDGGVRPALWLSLETVAALTGAQYIPFPIQKGDKHDSVKEAQAKLISLGFLDDKADGSFGEKTKVAVKAFQAEMGLEATGIVDKDTYQALME